MKFIYIDTVYLSGAQNENKIKKHEINTAASRSCKVTGGSFRVKQPPKDYSARKSRMVRLIKVVSKVVFSYNKQ